MTGIKPERDLRKELLKVNMPGRYVGGEYGSVIKNNAEYNIALCFPDLYEIGMSNQAVKLLYEMINTETEAACERVFNPAPDFEQIMREKGIPLYTLETGKKVKDHDLLAFTIGYELSSTNILSVIELSGIGLLNDDRTDDDPIIIAGGPAVTNPIPFGDFIDAVFIGEAEEVLCRLVEELAGMKNNGAGRSEMLSLIYESDYFWFKQRKTPVKKAVWNSFSLGKKDKKLIVPSIKTVQDHGVVEIMRGCPNGCRFCHAGIFYRPYREKSIDVIIDEVENLINTCGYREITLSSLSSGDYRYIKELITILNKKYSEKKISFSFPSMRVNSVTLPLIAEISKVRKSGLTFAVETPELIHQRGLNKEVPKERIIDILNEAKNLGWNKAKFYFMLGLPFFSENDETDLIIDFLREVGRESKMQINVNIGTFIPKPHTPFQWSFQLDEKSAFERAMKIKKALPEKFFKVSFQSPFISFIESMISRGDARSGELIIDAFKKGARLDAWEEYIQKDLWRTVFAEAPWNVEEEVCRQRSLDERLPWEDIILGAGKNFFKNEYGRAMAGELTEACATVCGHNCGACNEKDRVVINKKVDVDSYIENKVSLSEKRSVKLLFSFTKKEKASFLSHINMMNVLERAFMRSNLEVKHSQGFNPKPKLEFANPITLGFESEEEVAAIELLIDESLSDEKYCELFMDKMNDSLPEGIIITRAKIIQAIASFETGKKVKSLMASYNGGLYSIRCENKEITDIIVKQLSTDNGVEFSSKENEISLCSYRNKDGNILNIFKMLKENAGFETPFDHVEVNRIKTNCAVVSNDIILKKDYFSCYQ